MGVRTLNILTAANIPQPRLELYYLTNSTSFPPKIPTPASLPQTDLHNGSS